jgi:choline kinase
VRGSAAEAPVPERAILLAAGAGRRLGRHTEHHPKCLVRVGETSIAERMLSSLAAAGVREACIVVGFEAERTRATLTDRCGRMPIRYLHNPDYAVTHTGYSLWLAREFLDRDVAILEADVLVRAERLPGLLERRDSVWAAVVATPEHGEGILLRGAPDEPLREVRRFDSLPAPGSGFRHKCAGLQVLRGDAPELLADRLAAVIPRHPDRLADLVLGDVLDRVRIRLAPLPTEDWAEIDDEHDLVRARRLFAARAPRS